MRWLRELLTTMWPARAKASSISPATEASIAENTSSGAPVPGRASCTTRLASSAGIDAGRRHGAASRYNCPADRSLAPSQVTRNQGWLASCAMNCWPTMPVAPRTPTSIRCDIAAVLLVESAVGPHFSAAVGPTEVGPYCRTLLQTPSAQKKTADRLVPRRRVLCARVGLACLLRVEPGYTTVAAAMLSHGGAGNGDGRAGTRHCRPV